MAEFNTLEQKALSMLGTGTPANIVASALGVSEGRISQLLAEDAFASKVAELKFQNLNKQTVLDDRYSDMESKLLDRLEKTLPFLTKPRDVADVLGKINGTKRRGAQVIAAAHQQTQVVNLTLPVIIAQKFISNVNNQIVEVQNGQGEAETLVTATPASLDRLARDLSSAKQDSSNDSSEILLLRSSSEGLSKRLRQGLRDQGSNQDPVTIEDLL